MTKKRRVKLVLDEDEAAVIAPLEFWDHLRTIYEAYENDTANPSEKEQWQWASQLVSYWVQETKAVNVEEDY